MSIIKNGLYFSKDEKIRGFYKKQELSSENLSLLKGITPRQHKKFKSEKDKTKKLIPWQLLQIFWELGFLPGKEKPEEGMRLKPFLDFLSHGNYRDQRHQLKGIWLRDKIDEEEFPQTIRSQEMYLKVPGEGSKWVPASYFRDIPGTIIK